MDTRGAKSVAMSANASWTFEPWTLVMAIETNKSVETVTRVYRFVSNASRQKVLCVEAVIMDTTRQRGSDDVAWDAISRSEKCQVAIAFATRKWHMGSTTRRPSSRTWPSIVDALYPSSELFIRSARHRQQHERVSKYKCACE